MYRMMRLKIFLLCCLVIIGANAVLIMAGFTTTAIPAGDGRDPFAVQVDCAYERWAENR